MKNSLQTKSLLDGIKRLYDDGDFADLDIVCKERGWKVHKFCLCAHSPYFQLACGGPFFARKQTELVFDDEDPLVVGAFIYYCYHLDYSDYAPTGFSPMQMDVRMCAIADKYEVPPLKMLAEKKFDEAVTAWWNTRAFAETVKEVYHTTKAGEANPLKTSIMRVALLHANELLHPSDAPSAVLRVLEEVAEFGKDVSVGLVTQRDAPAGGKTNKTPKAQSAS